jgi:membrane protein
VRRRLRLGGRVLWAALRDMLEDGLAYWASAVAFDAVLSLFPLLLVGVSVTAWVLEPAWVIEQARALLPRAMPLSAGLVEETMREIVAARGPLGVLSLLALVWTGTRVFDVLTVALNVAFGAEETFGLLKRFAYQLLLTLSVGGALAVAIGAHLASDWLGGVLAAEGSPGAVRQGLDLLAKAGALLLLCVSLTLLYRMVPRRRPHWRAALAGAVVAAVLLRVARPLFVLFVERLSTFNLVYGSLVAFVLLLVWAWVTSLLVLFGGEVASHVQMLVLEQQSEPQVEQMHRERSPLRRPHDDDPSPPPAT